MTRHLQAAAEGRSLLFRLHSFPLSERYGSTKQSSAKISSPNREQGPVVVGTRRLAVTDGQRIRSERISLGGGGGWRAPESHVRTPRGERGKSARSQASVDVMKGKNPDDACMSHVRPHRGERVGMPGRTCLGPLDFYTFRLYPFRLTISRIFFSRESAVKVCALALHFPKKSTNLKLKIRLYN